MLPGFRFRIVILDDVRQQAMVIRWTNLSMFVLGWDIITENSLTPLGSLLLITDSIGALT